MSTTSKPEALERRLIYQSQWVNLYVDKVCFPNGMIIEQHHLLDFDHPGVMTIVRDRQGNYLMVKVCRYPTGSTEWEFPAGHMEEGEEIIQAGERELLEETGYHSIGHELLYSYYPLGGIANKVFHILRCKITDRIEEIDTGEIIEVRWFSQEDIWKMIRLNELHCGFTLTAFLLDQQI